jgi:hypothetical protein
VAEALGGGGFQFAFLHVKAVDDTGHDFLVKLKVRKMGSLQVETVECGETEGLAGVKVCTENGSRVDSPPLPG